MGNAAPSTNCEEGMDGAATELGPDCVRSGSELSPKTCQRLTTTDTVLFLEETRRLYKKYVFRARDFRSTRVPWV